jgi:TPR repeat protein/CHAT domain-containing protein
MRYPGRDAGQNRASVVGKPRAASLSGLVLLAALAMGLLPPLAEPAAASERTDQACDRAIVLADDPEHVGRPVPVDTLDLPKAIAACGAVVTRKPGKAQARFVLARLLESAGRFKDAAASYRRLANHGNGLAQAYLGDLYARGKGVPQSYRRAAIWFGKSASQGDPLGTLYLADLYFTGRGVDRDQGKAIAVYQRLAGQGNPRGQQELANVLINGDALPKDEAAAVALLAKAVDRHYFPAMVDLGSLYLVGEGVAKDPDRGVALFRSAVEAGVDEAYTALGLACELGAGVPKDLAMAEKWYRRAVEREAPTSSFFLGSLFLSHPETAPSRDEAIKWFRLAAAYQGRDSIGAMFGQSILGTVYQFGLGVPKNLAEAVKWYRGAADLGSANARLSLAGLYFSGEGVPQDYGEAVKWFRKAADQGSAVAQEALGVRYFLGQGVARDAAEAAKWFRKAADQGNEEARKALAGLTSGSPADQQSPELAEALDLNRKALALEGQGHYAGVEPLYRQALAIREKTLGPDHLDVAVSLNNLAALYEDLGRYAEAEPFYQRALAIREKALGPDHPDVAVSLNNLAHLDTTQGRYAEAEPLVKRALVILEKAFGPDDPHVGLVINNLANLYDHRYRYAEAEPLYLRALAIQEQALGPDHPDVAMSLSNLAGLDVNNSRYAEAESRYQRALAIRRKAFGPDHPDVAVSLSNLGALYWNQGRYAEAESYDREALAIKTRALGPDHPDVAISLENLSVLYDSQHRYAEAGPLKMRALEIKEKALGPDHPDVASYLSDMALFYGKQGRTREALERIRRASRIYRDRMMTPGRRQESGTESERIGRFKGTFHIHLGLLADRLSQEPSLRQDLTSESFEIGQLYRDGPVGAALAQMAVRYAAGNDTLAAVVREQQDTAQAFEKADADLVAMLTKPPLEYHPEAGAALRARAGALKDKLDGLSQRLAQDFPRYAELAVPRPVPLDQVQGLLKPGEALVALAANDVDAMVWLVRPDGSSFRHVTFDHAPAVIGKVTAGGAAEAVGIKAGDVILAIDGRTVSRFEDLRQIIGANPGRPLALTISRGGTQQTLTATPQASNVTDGAGAAKVVGLLGIERRSLLDRVETLLATLSPEQNPTLGRAFPVAEAYALYQDLLGPESERLADVKTLFVVADGPLESLPFSVLVTGPPAAGKPDYQKVAWLARGWAPVSLPTVSSLRALRTLASNASPAAEPFIGFGNPDFGGQSTGERGAGNAATGAPEPVVLTGGLLADPDRLRQNLEPLPGTADELKAIAGLLGAGSDSVILGAKASVSTVEATNLAAYRVVDFATHALVANDLEKLHLQGPEPAIALSVPAMATPEDDGLLRASRVAQLKLNADWVVLSACNSAAPDGTPNASSLSGLAKAFFYAGARAVVVSYWSVVSDTTVPLITGLFREWRAHPELGRAEALRRSMMAFLDHPPIPRYAHPMVWAPFVVAGEGGIGR